MRNYQNGAAFENECKRALESSGYMVVRSAGSHSPADLVAMRSKHATLAIQCKRNGRLYPEEWNQFCDWCEQAGCAPLMAEKVPRGIRWHLITGRKDGTQRAQPMCDWVPPHTLGGKR